MLDLVGTTESPLVARGFLSHSGATLRVMSWPILKDLESWSIDHEAGELRVVMADGTEARREWKAPSDGPIDFKRVTFRPGDLVLEMVTPWDEALEIEVYGEDDQWLRRKGRVVVYLDQNKWIQLAQSIHEPSRVPAHELNASRHLVDLGGTAK